MAIRYYQIDPNDPKHRPVWRNLSGESLRDLAQKLVDLSRPNDGGEQKDEPLVQEDEAP